MYTKYSLEQMRNFAFKNKISIEYRPHLYTRWNMSFSKILNNQNSKFNLNSDDVIVFLHIQKTAGTSFEKFLVKNMNIEYKCECNLGKKRCNCNKNNSTKQTWLFSRYSTGWMCGLHADYTELFVSDCVENVLDRKEGGHRKRRYFYTTFLREPVSRFISEYRHVDRGATWLSAKHMCNGKPPTPDELPLCFDPDVGWEGVTLDEFLDCPFNLAFNRQSRMLADLTLVNCYDTKTMSSEKRDQIILRSAKNNLKNFAFFGIKENMNASQVIFEKSFNLKFTKSLGVWNKSKSKDTKITKAQLEKIKYRNKLDIELYDYALKLFAKRMKKLNISGFEIPPSPYNLTYEEYLKENNNWV
ncbi:Heparan sulfate 6-O-sulfotransferase [Strongyloides ratti]|uniref:Heparan-sulfate 6-O-sulfotransferase n=1 Tax=Strongyloides ratti TaxID=34506 RepID=A0A090KQZ0_STRRB|nr:Heparan sulfate 6-O-sulfotransferase [Strongyloides ratti]CEF59789.1 Heparan sulfate 6-O-sulfotransferase [Strongyloides ratti]